MSLSLALVASGAVWGALGLLVGTAGVGESEFVHLLRDAFADALIILAFAALVASALASRALGWAYVLVLLLHAPVGSLVGLFMVMVIAVDRRGRP